MSIVFKKCQKRIQCPLQTLTYMFAWPSTSGKRAQTISSTLCTIPWDTDRIHLQGITALPLACLFRWHFCAVGGFQQVVDSVSGDTTGVHIR